MSQAQQLLSLSRAARLVGVSRSTLQKNIRVGALETFEGKIAITDLLRVYPNTSMEDETMLEKVTEIKAKARPKRGQHDATTLPSPEVLASRLTLLNQDLINISSWLNRYTCLIDKVKQKLQALQISDNELLNKEIPALYDWLESELQAQPTQVDKKAQLFAKSTFLRLMAANIKVLPSGREFFVEGTASILEAALHAGLNLSYGCASGNCGACKARIISGEVHKIREHDYIISDREKNLGYMLMCSNTAITDLVLEAAEAKCSEDILSRKIVGKVKKLERLTEDMVLLQVQTPRTKTLRFISGQSVTLTLAEDISGDYAIASCPCDGQHLQFHICKQPNNVFVEYVFNQLQPLQTLLIEGPKGNFLLQKESTNPAIFLAYEEGFAPIKSLIEHATALESAETLHLNWFAASTGRHYLNNLCRAWGDALDEFSYNKYIASEAELSTEISAMLQKQANLAQSEIYVAGKKIFVDACTANLAGLKIPETQIHTIIMDS